MGKWIDKYYPYLIGIVLVFVLAVSLLNARNDSLIYDEDAHIPAGYSYLTKQDIRLNPEHPPLLKNLAAFPLLFFKPRFDTSQPFWEENANDAQWNAGKHFLFGAGNDPDRIIFWSRVPFILLHLVLALFIFRWTRELSGITGGLVAFLLVALDPNLLGHNHYVTTDIGIAAFNAFAFCYFLRFLKTPDWKNTFIFSFFWGLVQLVKFSSVIAWPIYALAILVYSWVKLAPDGTAPRWKDRLRSLGGYAGKMLAAFGLSLLLVWVVYYLNARNTPAGKLPEIASYYFGSGKPNAFKEKMQEIIITLNGPALLRPWADYIFGVARVFQRVAGGNMVYYFGETSTRGFFSYFPVVFLIKTPFPILILIGAAVFWGLKSLFRKTEDWSAFIRHRITELTLLTFILFYSFTSIVGRLNIGLRHLFPIFPLFYLLVALAISRSISRTDNFRMRTFKYIFLLLLIFSLALETVAAYPNYLSYFNQAAGGPKNGYRYVTDSNADWGQDLKRLSSWIKEYNHCPPAGDIPSIGRSSDSLETCVLYRELGPISQIRLNYFGLADTRHYLGDRVIDWWDARRPIEPGWYAISTFFLQESLHDPKRPDTSDYSWLRNKKPTAQVGTSILIYYVSLEEATSINRMK